MLKGHIERARDMLIRDLEDLHGIKGWRIECVFDGFGRSTVGPLGESPASGKVSLLEREFNRQDTGRGVRIVYSGVGASAGRKLFSFHRRSVSHRILTSRLVMHRQLHRKEVSRRQGSHSRKAQRF